MSTTTWYLHTLVAPTLAGAGPPIRLDRRTAVLLAHVALTGPLARARAAGLLWPDAADATGRANLRQLLRRLGQAAGAALLGPGDPLALAVELEVDADALRADARAGRHADAAARAGRFLDGVDLDGLHDDLIAWVEATRAELDRLRVEAGHAEARRREADGDPGGAAVHLQRALTVDPLGEPTHRELMRVLYLAGDRAGALAAYRRCRAALRDELGVEPSAETRALADEIERARTRRRAGRAAALPLTVQRPPVLAGREREWAAMEDAWREGRGIVVSGPPGIGKSRLIQEFLDGHARALGFRGRPGDRSVPYGTHARTYRELVGAIGGGDALPAWTRRELARLIPELGEAPGPLTGEHDRLRFWNAKVEAHRVAHALGFDALGFDDLQYVDPASATAGQYVLAQLGADSATPVRTVHGYRTGELPDDITAILTEAAAAGMILLVELTPLDEAAVGELVASLGVPALDRLVPDLARYAGGSPLFVLETVKHLLETGDLDGGFPARLPPPGKTAAVLRARLDRLSAPALHLARILAVAREQFSLELAAAVTVHDRDDDAAGLIAAWTELEQARIVQGAAFSHDLLAEAVMASLPEPVGALLHHRVAEALDRTGAPPGSVAAHWLAAGETARADRGWRQAEVAARTTMLEGEAAHYFRAAATSH